MKPFARAAATVLATVCLVASASAASAAPTSWCLVQPPGANGPCTK
jgi:hypothetical protein